MKNADALIAAYVSSSAYVFIFACVIIRAYAIKNTSAFKIAYAILSAYAIREWAVVILAVSYVRLRVHMHFIMHMH